ncbi:MAG: hypothetical protein STSR0007_13690 [Thermovirga sp.]
MRFITPLRYPGGKAKLLPFFKELLIQNNLVGCRYVEPYAGGAGLALHLLQDQFVSHIYLNDISKPIYALWQSIINSTEDLCKKFSDTPVAMEQ